MARATGRGLALTFAVLVLLLGGLGALAAVTADRSVAGLLGRAPAPADAWRLRLRAVDAARARRDADAATRAWHDAYAAALTSRRWEAMLEVGDAALRAGAAAGSEEARAHARQAYLLAFTRAREEGAVDGVLRAAQAFADLGDRDVATQCLRVAEQMRAMMF